jgi:hypothetical protein
MNTDPKYTWWDFIEIGYALRYLEDATASSRIQNDLDNLGIVACLEIILNDLDIESELELAASNRIAARRLKIIHSEIAALLHANDANVLGSKLYEELSLAIRDLRFKLEEETRSRGLYPVIPAKHVSIERLLKHPISYFGLTESIALGVPEYALQDFQIAALCYAIGFSMPAIMSACRGVEALVFAFYEAVTERNPNSAKISWGTLIGELRNYKVDGQLLDLLDTLRKQRNFYAHANPHEDNIESVAEDVLLQSRVAVLRMIDHLRNHGIQFAPVAVFD